MANNTDITEQHSLSFPQRYWLLLCIIVAIISPIVVGWLDAAAHRQSYKDATEQRPVSNSAAAGGAAAPGGASGAATPSGATTPSGTSATATDSAK